MEIKAGTLVVVTGLSIKNKPPDFLAIVRETLPKDYFLVTTEEGEYSSSDKVEVHKMGLIPLAQTDGLKGPKEALLENLPEVIITLARHGIGPHPKTL